MKHRIWGWTSLLSTVLFASACTQIELPQAITSTPVTNLTALTEGRNVTLQWTNPQEEGFNGVALYKNNQSITTLSADQTTYFDRRAAVDTDLLYTLKATYSDGRVSQGVSTNVHVTMEGKAVPALLIMANSIDEIEDDDERSAAQWFQTHIPNGVILTPKDLSKINPDLYNVIWIQIDRVGLELGWKNLPDAVSSDAAISVLTQYAKDGGNILLTKHATQLVSAIGRIEDTYRPMLFSAGNGGVGTDTWTVNAVIGSGQAKFYDHRKHPIYQGLTTNMDFGHETYALEGPGLREDHNCMWDLNAYGFPTILPKAENVVKAFEELTASTVLGTWGHVADYCCAGIVEFNPTSSYPSKIIAIGLNAYEWNENGSVNLHQNNIEQLTLNAINYLSK